MKFAIQQNLMNHEQLLRVAEAVKPYPTVWLGLIPFSREITSEEPLAGKDYIPYGSTLLTTLVSELGWTGLHFDLERLNWECWVKNHPSMLNSHKNTRVLSAEGAIEYLNEVVGAPESEFFMRPSHDLKHFAGYVGVATELRDHLKSMIDSYHRGEHGTYPMRPDTPIVLATPQRILAEWRWFIVEGKIVSGSMYRAHGQLRKLRETDSAVIDEAQALADHWLPMDCVVMDTALTEEGVSIVEFNTINSSGFYDNDVEAVFRALWRYHET